MVLASDGSGSTWTARQVAVSKYADGLPLYRQEAIYARDGVELGRSLMAQWMGAVGFHFEPLAAHVLACIREVERTGWADMTGDGMQDIVLIHDGRIDYWPNLDYGRWGKRVTTHNVPRYPYGYVPKRILIGDIDGDGVADR